MKPSFATTAAALALVAALPAAAQYKVVGPDGRITYTDRPPSDGQQRVQQLRSDGAAVGEAASLAGLPLALRQVATRFPVMLIAGSTAGADACVPCDQARAALVARGIPFTERSVANDDDVRALQQLTGNSTVPALRVGGQMLKGYSDSDWQSTLDLAGYPKESQLPRNWRRPAAVPLAPRGAAASAPVDTGAAPSAPTAPPALPPERPDPGVPLIRF